MNEELEALLREAREQGATQADLDEITRRYNAEVETVDVTETPSVDGELENILIEARGLGATDEDLLEISRRYADEKPTVEVPPEVIDYDAAKLDLVKEIQQAEEIPAGTYKDVEELNKTLTPERLEEFKDTAVIEDKTEAQKILEAGAEFFGVDDLIDAARTGIAQGAVVDDALGVMMQGKNINKEDLDDYIEAVKNMESYEPSDAMVQFQEASKEAGGGLLGFIKGVANNPIVVPEIFTQSVFSLINKGSAAAAAPAALVGGAAGSVIPGAGTVGGAVSGGIAAASGSLETALTFTELLQDEVKKKGLEFDDDGIRQVLEDGNAMRNIRNKSMGRGAVIGVIDGISGGLASKLGTSVARKTGSKMLTGITGGTVEAAGGSLGEIAGTAVTGGEQNLQDILFEGIAGTATAPITVGRALLQSTEYKVNGQNVSRKFLKDFIENADPVDVAGATITIKDDPSLKKLAEEKRNDARLGAQLQEELEVEASKEDLAELVDLEKKRQRLTKSTTKTGQRRLSDIESQIENKTQEIRDAVQEQEPDEIPVQPEARVGEEVEEKAPEARPEEIAPEIAEEVEINVEAIKTNVTPESERILGLGLEAEDGATLNIDGTKYEQGGLVVPVASENIKQSELTPERVSEFIEKNRDKIGDTETVKPGLYKLPNQDVVSLDLNIVIPRENREVGLQFGKAAGQESLFDLDTFENVKTGATGESPMSFTPEQFKEIAVALKENRMPDFLLEKPIAIDEVSEGVKTITEPVVLFKGERGKIDEATGKKITAHPGVKGSFATFKQDIARDYNQWAAEEKGKPISEFEIPAGTTVEVISMAGTTPMSKLRAVETKAINESTADIVKLETVDASGRETQYIIKNKDILKTKRPVGKPKKPLTVSQLDNSIGRLLKTKLTKKEADRLKGRIGIDVQNAINDINSSINIDLNNTDAVESRINEISQAINEISDKTDPTEEDLNRAQALDLASKYLNAQLLEDTDVSKQALLAEAELELSTLIKEGRSKFKQELAEQAKYYKDILQVALSDVIGEEVDINNTEELNRLASRADKKIAERNRKNAKNLFKKAVKGIENLMLADEALEGLVDIVSKGPGDMFGGKLQELITDRVDDASINYKGRLIEVYNNTLLPNAKRIFGKKYKSIMLKNRKPMPNTGVFVDPKRVAEIDERLKTEKDKSIIDDLIKEKQDLELTASQNEMYYWYNQYKDPANHPAFESMFGEQHPEVMKNLEERLDPKVKEWADWQVNEFFPKLYPYYNEVYKRIYRTNMPWNEFYAGRIYRDGQTPQDIIDLLSKPGGYATYIGGTSTKVRKNNRKKILRVDGDNVITNYIKDMEHFAAYAETLRDINKIVKNEYVKKSMEANDGKSVLKYLSMSLEDIANRGIKKNTDVVIGNTLNDMFVISKLGLNPTVGLKQLTSAIAFADYIGYRNWTRLGAEVAKNPLKVWREMESISPFLQDRYKNSDIRKVMEAYNENLATETLVGTNKDKVINFLMYLIKLGDKGGVAGSMSNYLFYKNKFAKEFPGLSEEKIKEKAIRKVEKQIKRTQQSYDVQDKSALQRGNLRVFSMFLSSTKALLRKEINASRQLYRKAVSLDPKAGKGTIKENLRSFMTYHVAIPVLVQYVSLGFPGLLAEWEDEDLEELTWAAFLGNLNAIFALGDALQTIREYATGKPWAGDVNAIPVLSIPAKLISSINDISKAKNPREKEKAFNKFLKELPFVPYSNLKKMYNNWTELIEGNNEGFEKKLLRLMNFNEYVIKKSKKRKKTK